MTGTGPRRTRQAITDALAGSADGMTAVELAHALGLHPNAVRKHLRALTEDGSVGAEGEFSGRRGRPAVRYRAAEGRRAEAATLRLARLLVELVSEIGPDEDRVEQFGRRQAAGLATSGDARTALIDLMTTMGFAPRETTRSSRSREGGLELVLGHCPLRDAVTADGGALVCVLHRGISRGLVEMSPSGRLTSFEIHPPEEAGCRIAAEGLRPPGVAGGSGPRAASPRRRERADQGGQPPTVGA